MKNKYSLSVAGLELGFVSDAELSFPQNLTVFLTDYHNPDIEYRVHAVEEPFSLIPSDAKKIYSGSGMQVVQSKDNLYHKYFYGGEASMLFAGKDGEGSDIYICEKKSCTNIQKSLSLETKLLDFDGVFFHASLVDFNGIGIMFTAASGVGKSTQASLWSNHRNAEILNGDRTAVRFVHGEWMAYGSPWAGSSGIYKNKSVKLSAIVSLGQSENNLCERLFGISAFKASLNGEVLPYWSKSGVGKACVITEKLICDVPVFEFKCTPDVKAVEVLESILKSEGVL